MIQAFPPAMLAALITCLFWYGIQYLYFRKRIKEKKAKVPGLIITYLGCVGLNMGFQPGFSPYMDDNMRIFGGVVWFVGFLIIGHLRIRKAIK